MKAASARSSPTPNGISCSPCIATTPTTAACSARRRPASTTPGSTCPPGDLEAWQDHLEVNGVVRSDTADKPLTQSPIADEVYGSVLVFRDPDNIQLELFAPAHH